MNTQTLFDIAEKYADFINKNPHIMDVKTQLTIHTIDLCTF